MNNFAYLNRDFNPDATGSGDATVPLPSSDGLMLGGIGSENGTGRLFSIGMRYFCTGFSNGGTGVTYHLCGSCLGVLVVLGYGALSCFNCFALVEASGLLKLLREAQLCVLTACLCFVSALGFSSLGLVLPLALGDISRVVPVGDVGVEACELHKWNILWFDPPKLQFQYVAGFGDKGVLV